MGKVKQCLSFRLLPAFLILPPPLLPLVALPLVLTQLVFPRVIKMVQHLFWAVVEKVPLPDAGNELSWSLFLAGELFLAGSSPAASGAALNRTQVGGRRRQISVEGAAVHNPPSPSSTGRGFSCQPRCSSTSGPPMRCVHCKVGCEQ